MTPARLDDPAADWPTWAVFAGSAAALWSRPDAPGPAPAIYHSPPPMAIDLRLPVPILGDQP